MFNKLNFKSMKTKIEVEDGVTTLTLIPETVLEEGIVNSINCFNIDAKVSRPTVDREGDTKQCLKINLTYNKTL